jgi:hypothetical protein
MGSRKKKAKRSWNLKTGITETAVKGITVKGGRTVQQVPVEK